MSKNLQRILMLVGVGIALGAIALFQIVQGTDSDHVFIGIAYLVPSITAFIAVLKLPTKAAE